MSLGVVVLGDGVNELVAAHTLARAGHRVTVIARERFAETESPESGWVPPSIVRDLDLERHGLKVQCADPWAVVALPDGGRLELGHDVARTAEAIRRVSSRDAARWPEFCERMNRLALLLQSLYLAPPPDPLAQGLGALAQLGRLGLEVRRLGRQGMEDLFRLLPMSVADLLDDEFESDALKGALGAAGVVHLHQGPRAGGTAFNLLHHHVGSPIGVFRAPLSNSRAVLARLPGIETRVARVTEIIVRAGRAGGVVLADGEAIEATLIVSGLDPKRTLLELVDVGCLDPELVRAVRNIRDRGVVARLTLTLDRDPGFTTLVVAPSLDYLERAHDDAKYGRVSREPYIEARYIGPSDGGPHRVSVHVQYVPHTLGGAQWDTAQRDGLARTVIAGLAGVASGFAGSVIEQHLVTPGDLENLHGLPEGQEYHAELALDQVLWMRPVPQLAQYRTPIGGLYLCGPAMHPGGGVAGAAGANAARVVLQDMRRGVIRDDRQRISK